VLQSSVTAPGRIRASRTVPAGHAPAVQALPIPRPTDFVRTALVDARRRNEVSVDVAAVDPEPRFDDGHEHHHRSVTPRAVTELPPWRTLRRDFRVFKPALPILEVDGSLPLVQARSPVRGHVSPRPTR